MAITPEIVERLLDRLKTMSDEEFSEKLDRAIPSWATPEERARIVHSGAGKKNGSTNVKKQDRTVSRRSDGKWENKRNSASRATSVHDTQKAAEKAAKANLRNQGGGEVTIKGRDGKIRAKDTVKPGNDPHPPKG